MNNQTPTTVTAYGLETRVWTFDNKRGYGCAECCNGDRCDEDCTAKYKGGRKGCPHCKGDGWIPESEVTQPSTPPAEQTAETYLFNIAEPASNFKPHAAVVTVDQAEEYADLRIKETLEAAAKELPTLEQFMESVGDNWSDTSELYEWMREQAAPIIAAKDEEICNLRLEAQADDVAFAALSEENESLRSRVRELEARGATSGQMYVYNGIDNSIEGVSSFDEAQDVVKEMIIEGNELHPDAESVYIVQTIGIVSVEETDESTEIDGQVAPVCKVKIVPLTPPSEK